MSLSELLPIVNSLSRLDKLRLIRCITENLSDGESSPSPTDQEIDVEFQDIEHLHSGIHAVALRNAVGRLEEGPHVVVEDSVARTGQVVAPPTMTGESYPYWSPDRDSEASAKLMKLLEAEKPAS